MKQKLTVCRSGGSGRTPSGEATSRHLAGEVDLAGQDRCRLANQQGTFSRVSPINVKMASENAERREKRENLDKSCRECFLSINKGFEG